MKVYKNKMNKSMQKLKSYKANMIKLMQIINNYKTQTHKKQMTTIYY